MHDVITFGSATVDAFAKTDAEMISFGNENGRQEFIAYASGSKILIEELHYEVGGGGTNTAVAFSRLGLKTAFAGIIGNDANGKLILALLQKEKVDFLGKVADGMSGFSVILDSFMEDRTILTYKGVNNSLVHSDLDKDNLRAKWFYFSAMLGDSYKTFIRLTEFARKNGIKVAFNPSSYLAKQGYDFLKKPLSNTTVMVLNLEEARYLAGNREIKSLLRELHSYGPRYVAITDGGRGAYASDGKTMMHIPALKVKIKETTGAGDAFASGFVCGLMLKNDIHYALKLGAANSSSVIMYLGAKNKLLTLKQADAMKVPAARPMK